MERKVSDISSEIIGSLNPDKRASSSTGMQPGETGSGAITVAGLFDQTASVAKNDRKLLALWRQALGTSLVTQETTTYENGQFAGVALSECKIADDVSVDVLNRLGAGLAAFLAPLGHRDMAKALAVLRVSAVPRQAGELDVDLQTEVYADALRRYPADVARAVLERNWKWFPSLGELREAADRMMGQRRRMKGALDRARVALR